MKFNIFQNILINYSKKFIPYLICGSLNTLLSYLIYFFLVVIEINYLYAHSISALFSIVFVYFLYSKFIWNYTSLSSIKKFIEIVILNYFLSIVLLFILVDLFNTNLLIAPIINIALLYLLRFFLLNNYVFKN